MNRSLRVWSVVGQTGVNPRVRMFEGINFGKEQVKSFRIVRSQMIQLKNFESVH